jgi:hypothetical protein
MKTNAVVLLLTGLLLTNLPAAAVSIEGVVIPGTLALQGSDQELVLNGAGIRKKFFMDIYIGALYLPARTSDATAILSDNGAASVLMHFLYKEVGRDKITDGWNDGLRENISGEEFQTLAKRLEKFNALFRTVRKGDVIRIDYNPVTGTEVRINDEWRGSIEGNDFFRALLKIWLGGHPVSRSLKDEMLGRPD